MLLNREKFVKLHDWVQFKKYMFLNFKIYMSFLQMQSLKNLETASSQNLVSLFC